MKLARIAVSPIAAIGKALFKGPGKPPAPLKTPTRDDIIVNREALDELARRRGGAAAMLSGSAGFEAPAATGKTVLGS